MWQIAFAIELPRCRPIQICRGGCAYHGGRSGIGLATAGAFARQGAKVVIASRREATAKTALKQLAVLGDAHWFPVDTTDGKAVRRLMDAIMKMHGRLHYAFNNGGGAAYSAAKHGVIGLTRSAALEHAAQGPRICAVAPGWINTPPVANWMKRDEDVAKAITRQTPRGSIGTADEVAAAVLWLCSEASSFAVGTVLAIDGGYLA
nr:SDR family oxidoreductase [Bradyrhizobium sp.]